MHVAITIVGYRNPDDIRRCLHALEDSSFQDFEVIICENGGAASYAALTDLLPSKLAGGQTVRAVRAPRNLGYAGGVNLCLRETTAADAWWVLNPDTEPSPDALLALVNRLTVGDCEAAGCTLQLPNGRVQSYGGRWQPWLARAVSIGYGRSPAMTVDARTIESRQNYLSGACMLISRRFLEVTGPMREDYFLYCEEVEWCLRAIARGMRLGFAPGGFVLHRVGTATGNPPDMRSRSRAPVYLSTRNQILLTRDCFPARLPIAASSALAVLLFRCARRGAWRQLGYGLSGWIAGLRDERGKPSWIEDNDG
jgi:GT2 family glycosyltransferase